MDFKITVTTPKAPNFISVRMPGKAKDSRMALSEFTNEQLEEIGDDMKAGLLKRANEQLIAMGKQPATGTGPKKGSKAPS